MFESDVHFRSFLLSNTTPTMATSNSTETISNGNRYWDWVNSNLPSETVSPSSRGDSWAPSGELRFERLIRNQGGGRGVALGRAQGYPAEPPPGGHRRGPGRGLRRGAA